MVDVDVAKSFRMKENHVKETLGLIKRYVRRTIILIVVFLITFISVFVCSKYIRMRSIGKKGDMLKETLSSYSDGETTINNVIPFEYDLMYVATPYESVDAITDALGIESEYINESTNEGMQNIIFVRDSKVICSVCGYPENLGYSISIMNTSTKAEISSEKISRSEDRKVEVSHEGGIAYITMIE